MLSWWLLRQKCIDIFLKIHYVIMYFLYIVCVCERERESKREKVIFLWTSNVVDWNDCNNIRMINDILLLYICLFVRKMLRHYHGLQRRCSSIISRYSYIVIISGRYDLRGDIYKFIPLNNILNSLCILHIAQWFYPLTPQL